MNESKQEKLKNALQVLIMHINTLDEEDELNDLIKARIKATIDLVKKAKGENWREPRVGAKKGEERDERK